MPVYIETLGTEHRLTAPFAVASPLALLAVRTPVAKAVRERGAPSE